VESKQFHEIFAREVEAISARREKHGRPKIVLEEEDRERDGTPVLRPTPDSKVIGLALSGGGIRSSAFCLGAMQALDAPRKLIDKIDYLSTVSGGGYIGTSMTAAMSTGCAGKFPFESELREGEVAGVQHIRDHSNYLFPNGALNIVGNLVVYLRGLVANAVLLLPWLLLAAAYTIWSNPSVQALTETNASHFGLAIDGLFVFVTLLLLWALWRSPPAATPEFGLATRCLSLLVLCIVTLAIVESLPVILAQMYIYERNATTKLTPDRWFANISERLQWWATFLAPLGAGANFLVRYLAGFSKTSGSEVSLQNTIAPLIATILRYVGAGAISLFFGIVVFYFYIYLSFWGIQDCTASCVYHAPEWLKTLAGWTPFPGGSILTLYYVVGVALLVISSQLNPNFNSLHRLYRDRLSKAFLFDPTRRVAARALPHLKGKTGEEADPRLRNCDLQPLDRLKVSELRTDLAPYHLINTALNIGHSKHVNRRGRNADFFIFSPLFTGSEVTRYVDTKLMERRMRSLTAGTAMAVSGAAASSNMGSATIKPLVPTLALLNIRLGYWLPNPASIAGDLNESFIARFFDKLYSLKELLGLLSENDQIIYLTDGGHIENLGIYELLRRRCKLIIAIDGEADPDMSFGALVKLQRYARIDFSLRIDLPWAALRDATKKASEDIRKSGGEPPNKAPHGPHCALGTIYYPPKAGGEKDEADSTGVLLYIKASLTGDENDYVIDYKQRYPAFPHETTLDQLFSEEQFEAYRALGFHAVNSAFKLVDKVSMNPEPVKWQGPTTTIPLEKRLRDILGLDRPKKHPPA
jgi:hypothetical protein